jgi:hypothetical protein
MMSKTFTINIVTLSPSSLPNGTVGTPYLQIISHGGGNTGQESYSIQGGSLPDGLTLAPLTSTTAVISGTPTTAGTSAFFIQVNDGVVSCNKAYTLEVESACPDWTTLLWGVANQGGVGAGSGTFTPDSTTGDSFAATASAPDGGGADFGIGNNTGTIAYNGTGCDCNLHYDAILVGDSNFIGGTIGITLLPDFLVLAVVSLNGGASGSADVPFTIPDTLGADKTIAVDVLAQCPVAGIAGGLISISLSGQITNVP